MSHTYSNLLSGIANENSAKVLSLNAMPDHLHMLWELPPRASLSDSMRILKTNSSRWIHETWGSRSEFAWQTGYGAFSVSRSNVNAVANYIEAQETHHRKRTFEQEFVELLVKHGIEYDPKFVLG
jgi:putative transposase